MTGQIVALVGAGTGVGKTFVGVGLIASMRRNGRGCLGLKPVESGVVDVAEDAAALGRAAGRLVPPRYALKAAVSPHRAARMANESISLEEVSAWVDRHRADVVVVETAGGLLSPLTADGRTNLDLCDQLGVHGVVAVAKDELGALHQVSALMMALRSRGLDERTVVVLNRLDPSAADLENAAELRRLGVAARVVIVERAPGVTGDQGPEGGLRAPSGEGEGAGSLEWQGAFDGLRSLMSESQLGHARR